jgi:uncharacterized membrane protein YgcG
MHFESFLSGGSPKGQNVRQTPKNEERCLSKSSLLLSLSVSYHFRASVVRCGFTMAVLKPLERKLEKRTSVHCAASQPDAAAASIPCSLDEWQCWDGSGGSGGSGGGGSGGGSSGGGLAWRHG